MEDKQLALQPRFRDLSLAEIKSVATALFASGIFKDTTDASIAFAKILAGQEMGLGPFAAMQEISFINGKPSLSSTAKAAKILEHPRYDYIVQELDGEHCILEFFKDGKSRGTVEYNEGMAKLGGEYNRNSNYKSHPDDMYFAGAIRKGQRRFAPDALSGIATYDREEFVEAEVVEARPNIATTDLEKPTPPEEVPAPDPERVKPMQLRKMMAQLRGLDITDADMQKQLIYALGKVKSRTELTVESADMIINTLEASTKEDLLESIGGANDQD